MIEVSSEVGSNQHRKDEITIMLADDHPLMRDALRNHLETQPDFKVIAEVGDGEEAVRLAVELVPDLVIMDIAMPKLNGLEATTQIKEKCPNVTVLILSVHSESEYILKVLEAGATGYLNKSIFGEEIINAIRSVVSGLSVLSDVVMRQLLNHTLRQPIKPSFTFIGERFSIREIEIIRLLARGMSNKDIAQELSLSVRTVKGYLVSIFSKLRVSSRTEAIITGLRVGFLTLDDLG